MIHTAKLRSRNIRDIAAGVIFYRFTKEALANEIKPPHLLYFAGRQSTDDPDQTGQNHAKVPFAAVTHPTC
jgi:hypothetical protein